jgi:hypothetical protein
MTPIASNNGSQRNGQEDRLAKTHPINTTFLLPPHTLFTHLVNGSKYKQRNYNWNQKANRHQSAKINYA